MILIGERERAGGARTKKVEGTRVIWIKVGNKVRRKVGSQVFFLWLQWKNHDLIDGRQFQRQGSLLQQEWQWEKYLDGTLWISLLLLDALVDDDVNLT